MFGFIVRAARGVRFDFDDVMEWLYDHEIVATGLVLAMFFGLMWMAANSRDKLRERCIDACAPAGGAWSSDLSTCLCIDEHGRKSLRKPAE